LILQEIDDEKKTRARRVQMGITDAGAAATPLGQRLHAEKRQINSYDAYRITYRMDVLRRRREAIMARSWARYTKMLKVGLPEQVVRQRMRPRRLA
jgi:hypothetical protein